MENAFLRFLIFIVAQIRKIVNSFKHNRGNTLDFFEVLR